MPPDPKPAKRIRDQEALWRYRLKMANEPCERCELRPGIHAHHQIFRSQSGDDVESNWIWLCMVCHHAAHGIRAFV